MNMNKTAAVLIVSFLCAPLALADTLLSPGETGTQFLVMPLSARSIALGGGLAGLAGEIQGFECNPAVLPTLKDHQASFSRSQHFQDSNLTSFAVALKAVKRIGFGIQYRRFGVTDTGRESSGFETGEDIQVYDNGFQAGTGYGFFDGKLSLGYSVEYMRRFIYRYTAISYAHNVGLMADFFKGKHTFGVSLQNLGEPVTFISANEPLPAVFRAGGAHRFMERDVDMFEDAGVFAQPVWTAVWEIDQFRDQKRLGGSAGLEWRPFEMMVFRLGAERRPEFQVSGGLGFQWKSLQLDYAAQSRPEVGLAHTVSLAVRWSSIDFDLGD